MADQPTTPTDLDAREIKDLAELEIDDADQDPNLTLIDDITGDIDDNEFDRAIATITKNLANIDDEGRASIQDAAQIAGGDAEKKILAALNPKPKATRAPRKPANQAIRPSRSKKTPAQTEFAPVVNDKGRLDHSGCGHTRDMKGRTACRAWYAKNKTN
jgi:hypothetical protein